MQDLLQRLAAAHWVGKVSKEWSDEAKQAVLDAYGPGDRVHARMNGKDIGTISVTQPEPKETAVVADPSRFLAWVKANKPEAVVEAVADWFKDSSNLLAIIEATGEVPDGVEVEVKERAPYVSVRLSPKQAAELEGMASTTPITALIEGGSGE